MYSSHIIFLSSLRFHYCAQTCCNSCLFSFSVTLIKEPPSHRPRATDLRGSSRASLHDSLITEDSRQRVGVLQSTHTPCWRHTVLYAVTRSQTALGWQATLWQIFIYSCGGTSAWQRPNTSELNTSQPFAAPAAHDSTSLCWTHSPRDHPFRYTSGSVVTLPSDNTSPVWSSEQEPEREIYKLLYVLYTPHSMLIWTLN